MSPFLCEKITERQRIRDTPQRRLSVNVGSVGNRTALSQSMPWVPWLVPHPKERPVGRQPSCSGARVLRAYRFRWSLLLRAILARWARETPECSLPVGSLRPSGCLRRGKGKPSQLWPVRSRGPAAGCEHLLNTAEGGAGIDSSSPSALQGWLSEWVGTLGHFFPKYCL